MTHSDELLELPATPPGVRTRLAHRLDTGQLNRSTAGKRRQNIQDLAVAHRGSGVVHRDGVQ
jgi:hypothetical protein